MDDVSTKALKIIVPKNQSARYNQAHALTQRIIAMAKKDGEVFRMVMSQFEQIYQICVLVKRQ